MEKRRSVSISTGGGGRALPAKLGIEDISSLCHAELVSASVQRGVLPVTLDRSRNKFGMTFAFTMAEILLSLTIIGVVAAITLPSLTGNINERTWNTQRKALYARFSQAIALMPALNGYGTLTEGDSSTSAVDTAAETFVTAGLSKVLKINNICDHEHLEDCGIASKFITLKGNDIGSIPRTLVGLNPMFNSSVANSGTIVYSYSQIDTKAAAFETANGESIVVYYNPNCVGSLNEGDSYYSQPKMCANFIYDLNGSKGPNTMGKDVGFISVLYPSDSVVVAPLPLTSSAGTSTQTDAGKLCQKLDSESRLPTREELAAMFYNKLLIDMPEGNDANAWSSSVIYESGALKAVNQGFISGIQLYFNRSSRFGVRCVKR